MGYLNKFVISCSSAHIHRQMLPLLQAEDGAEVALLSYVEGFLQGFAWTPERRPAGLSWCNAAADASAVMRWQVAREDLGCEAALGGLAVMLGVLPSIADAWASRGGMALLLAPRAELGRCEAAICLQNSAQTVGVARVAHRSGASARCWSVGAPQRSQIAETERALRQCLAAVQADINAL